MTDSTDPMVPALGSHWLSFGDFMRLARRKKGMTQVALAQATGRTQQSVTRWESGDVPPLAVLAKISSALGVPMDQLMRYQGEKPATVADRVRDLEEFYEMLALELADAKRQVQELTTELLEARRLLVAHGIHYGPR